METIWRVTLFGEMRCYRVGEKTPALVKFETEKTRRLLAYLLLHSVRSHSREVLATLLWPDSPPDKTRRRLRDALLALRTEFKTEGGPALFPGDRTTLGLAPGAFLTDAAEFTAAGKAAEAADKRNDAATALIEWEKAATLYAGPLLDGVYDAPGGEDWIELLRGHYAAGYDAALIRLSVLCAAQDRLPDALTYARKAVHNDPDDADRKAWLLELTERQRHAEKTQFSAAPLRTAPAPAPPEAPFPPYSRPGSLNEGNYFIAPAAKAMEEGDYYKALGFYLSALAGEVTHTEQMTIAHQLQQLGLSAHFRDRGKGNISLTALAEATRIFRANGHAYYTATTLINVADTAILLGRRAGALAAVCEAYETAKTLPQRNEQGNLFVCVAETSLVMGEYELVRAALDEAIPICCALEAPSLLAQAWRFQGEYLSDKGDYEAARRYLNDAASLLDTTNDQQTRAAVLGLLGDVGYRQAKQGEATDYAEYYEEGLKIWESLPHPFWMAQFKARLARVAYNRGDAPQAERLANEALTLLDGCGGQTGRALPLYVLGLLHADWLQFGEAMKNLRECVALRRKVGNPRALAEALEGLSYSERAMGDYKQAIVHREEAARLRQQARTPLPPVQKSWDAKERATLGMPPLE